MKKSSLALFLLLFLFQQAFAQHNDTWVAFWNRDSTLIGFKDKTGKIKIAPMFSDYTTAGRFDNIMGVSQNKENKISNYYLTKRGKIVGKDSLYTFDNGADCESEGYIRFRDKITHKIGMFNSDGKIAILAIYNYLTPVRNGLIIAKKGAHWDERLRSEENEFPWVGGITLLINIHNQPLIQNFPIDNDINFFSPIVSKHPDKSPIRQNFKAVDGKYYSFINFDKEFKIWLKDSLVNKITKPSLLKFSYKNIYYFDKSKGWMHETRESFIEKNYDLIKSKLLELNNTHCDYIITTEGLNPYIYNSTQFQKYFDNCGASKNWIYPIKNIVITHKVNNDILQDQIEFLKTDSGYKLIEVSINVGKVNY